MSPQHNFLSPTKKGELFGKVKSGRSIRAVANELGVPKSTGHDIVKHREATGTVRPQWSKGPGSSLSPQDEDRLIRHVRRSPKQTAEQISSYMQLSHPPFAVFSKSIPSAAADAAASPFCVLRASRIGLPGPLPMRIRTGFGLFSQTRLLLSSGTISPMRVAGERSMKSTMKIVCPLRKKRGKVLHVWGAIIRGQVPTRPIRS